MSLYNVFDISGTGMSAQNVRLNTTASNISNANTISSVKMRLTERAILCLPLN